MPRTIAIGDIHGCATALRSLLEAVAPRPDDLIVPLGDYIDRGPDSSDVVEQLIALSSRCRMKPLLGNHELMFLRALEDRGEFNFWRRVGGAETLESYGSVEKVPATHLDFIRSCRRFFATATHFFVHANYDPDVAIEDQTEHDLFWRHLSSELTPPHQSGKIAVVGHTPQVSGEIFDGGHVVCIDTFSFGGGWLTAYDVHSGQTWQANQQGQTR